MWYDKLLNKQDNNVKPYDLNFLRVPAGEYHVGYEKGQLFAAPAKHSFIKTRTTPVKKVSIKSFKITREPIKINDLINCRNVLENFNNIIKNVDELNPGGFAMVDAQTADKICNSLGGILPRWYEWEAAMRGKQEYLYPWGNEFDVNANQVFISTEKYSIDEESTMGYYNQSESVSFINYFGEYETKNSILGLSSLAAPGMREWNANFENEFLDVDKYLLRSICDLGHMTLEIPGIRPGTWSGGNNYPVYRAFSGPNLTQYQPDDVGFEIIGKKLFSKACFRILMYL